MAGTDVSVFADSDYNNNHTYYGNGCTEYNPSAMSCETNMQKTYDNETQLIGTYYNFQAPAVGSGGQSIATEYTIVPDSFCPLGWQMPYSGTGGDYYNKSKSWKYFADSYSLADDTAGSNKIRSYPFSAVYGGLYSNPSGTLYTMGNIQKLWSNTIYAYSRAYELYIGSGNVKAYEIEVKNNSIGVRCVWKLASGCNYLVYVLK